MTLVKVPENVIRRTTAILVVGFGTVGLVVSLSDEGPRPGVQQAIVIAVLLSTVPVGLFIASTPMNLRWRRQRNRRALVLTIAFVAYADLGVSAVLLTFASREGGLYGTALFAIIGVYAAFFAPHRYVTAHVLYVCVFITIMAWLTWRAGEHDTASVIARWMVSILSANCALGMLRSFTNQVQTALDTSHEHATHDPLTGLLNRRGLESWADRSLHSWLHPMGFVILDVDHFKSVNDRHGHEAGDSVLVLASSRLRKLLGDEATIARTGGEEFALVLTADLAESARVANAIRLGLHDPGDDIPITVSVGVSSLATAELLRYVPLDALNEGIRRADVAMFDAKHAGRNRVHTYRRTDASTLPLPPPTDGP